MQFREVQELAALLQRSMLDVPMATSSTSDTSSTSGTSSTSA